MELTPDRLALMVEGCRTPDVWAPLLNTMWRERGITTPRRQAAFLAQAGHETGSFRWLVEIWGPTGAQSRYDGRVDLGNTEPGDGYRYRGRGIFHLTGRATYRAAGFEDEPNRVSEPEHAVWTAGWYWRSHDLEHPADRMDLQEITRRINGGTNGYTDRCVRYVRALSVIGVDISGQPALV